MNQLEVEFMGRITAGMSHEIRNVLAIIRESAGLVEDLFLLAEKEVQVPHADKFYKALGRVQEQVRRGAEIGGRLGQFAHSMDEPESRVDLDDFLEHIALLFSRFADQKKKRLKAYPSTGPIIVRTDLFRLQLVVFYCLEYLLNQDVSGDQIGLWSFEKEPVLALKVLHETEQPPNLLDWAGMKDSPEIFVGQAALLHKLGLKLYLSEDRQFPSLALIFEK